LKGSKDVSKIPFQNKYFHTNNSDCIQKQYSRFLESMQAHRARRIENFRDCKFKKKGWLQTFESKLGEKNPRPHRK